MKITKQMTDELNIILLNLGCSFKFKFDEQCHSIKVIPSNSIFIKNSIINLTNDCYDLINAFFKTKNIELNYNNTKDIMWAKENTNKYNKNSPYYNLFVLKDDTMENNMFIMPQNKSLQKHTTDEQILKKFVEVTPSTEKAIKTMPSLFVNQDVVFLGKVTNIKIQSNGIKVKFIKISNIGKNNLNKIINNLNIKHKELDTLHWTIKKTDIPLIYLLYEEHII